MNTVGQGLNPRSSACELCDTAEGFKCPGALCPHTSEGLTPAPSVRGRCGDLVSLAKSSSECGVGHSAETRRGLVGAVDSTADAVTSHRPRLDAALPVTPRACSRATAPSLCFVWE